MPQSTRTTIGAPSANGFSPFQPSPHTEASRSKDWYGFQLHYHCLPVLEVPQHLVTGHQLDIHLGPATPLRIRQDGRWQTGHFFRGETIYTPPGTWCGGSWNAEREVLIISLDHAFLVHALQDSVRGDLADIAPQFKLRDPLIEHLGLALGAEFTVEQTVDRLYAESLATTLAVHLVNRYSARHQAVRAYRRGLPPHKLQRVLDYIHDHLADDLSLAALAASAHMNPHHLTRTFKQATGLPPHQYVMRQRTEQAKRLLARTERPIAEIALDVGFKDQSHFTKVFYRHTGVTPKRYRVLRET